MVSTALSLESFSLIVRQEIQVKARWKRHLRRCWNNSGRSGGAKSRSHSFTTL